MLSEGSAETATVAAAGSVTGSAACGPSTFRPLALPENYKFSDSRMEV